jgi:hypothetical protein
MSAFVCSPDHFIALGVFASHGTSHSGPRVNPRYFKEFSEQEKQYSGIELANFYANILFRENVRSVQYRYPDDKNLPGPINMPEAITVKPMHCAYAPWVLPAVSILKMCDCLEYQSCETRDYYDSLAYELLQAIRKSAIRLLPGSEQRRAGRELGLEIQGGTGMGELP